MSYTPPPPGAPPPPSAPPPSPPPPGAPPPPDVPGFSSRGGGLVVLMLVGFVAILATGVLAVIFLPGRSSDDSLRTAEAADRLQELIDDTVRDDDGSGDLRRCPIERTNRLIDGLLDQLDDRRLDVLARSGTEDAAAVLAFAGSRVDLVVCDRFVDDDNLAVLGVGVAPAPRRLDRFVDELAGEDARPGTGDLLEGDGHRGGTFSRTCVEYDDPVDTFCEVYWVDDELLISIYLVGASSIRIDLDDVESVLRRSLDEWVDALAG